MGRWAIGIVLKSLTAMLCVAVMAWLALWYLIPAPPTSIVIATGPAGGTLDHIAQRYRASLAPHIKLDQRSTDGVLENLRLLKELQGSTLHSMWEAPPTARNRRS